MRRKINNIIFEFLRGIFSPQIKVDSTLCIQHLLLKGTSAFQNQQGCKTIMPIIMLRYIYIYIYIYPDIQQHTLKMSIYTLGLQQVVINCMFIHAFSFFFLKFYSVNTCWMSFTDYWLEQHVRYLSSQSDLSRQWALVNIDNVYKREFGRSEQFNQ